MLWLIMGVVFVAGCLGGLLTAIISGERQHRNEGGAISFAYTNQDCETRFANRLGNVLLGGVSALLFWALYGPFSGFPVVGAAPTAAAGVQPALKVGELAASFVIGTGGAGFLRAEARRRCAENRLRKSRAA